MSLSALCLQMLHHLQRRRDLKEIWGCRHMVEVRHGEMVQYAADHAFSDCSVYTLCIHTCTLVRFASEWNSMSQEEERQI